MPDAGQPLKKKAAPRAADELRRQAEERLDGLSAAAASSSSSSPASEDLATAVHDLRVHQIELETQNEELRRAQLELDAQRAKYFELFDLAPMGYLTLGDKGMVLEANLSAARLLGVERRQLVGRPLSSFILADDQDVYYRHRKLLEQTGEPQTCELRIQSVGTGVFNARSDTYKWISVNAVPQFRPGKASPHRVFTTFDDITARRETAEVTRLHAELKEAHLLLEQTQAISKLGGWEYTVADHHLTWTEEVRRIFGVGADYDPNDASHDIGSYAPQSAPLMEEAFRRALESGEPYDLELEFERADGVRIWIRSIGHPVILNDVVIHVVGSIMDITARKEAEEALLRRSAEVERQQALLATLLDTIPSPVFYKDAAGVYLGCNPAFERLVGRERGEIVGKTAADLGPPEITERYEAMDRRLLEQPGTQTYEWPVKAADGSLHDVIFNKATFNDSGGQIAGIVGVILDITERKRIEAALLESEERLLSLFETMTEGVVLIAADGQIVSANPAAESILGLTRSQIKERVYDSPQWELLRPDGTPMPPEERAVARATKEKRAVKDVVMGAVRPDGSVSWINVNAAPLLDAAGEVDGVVGTFTDVTARKRAEEALRESDERQREILEHGGIGVAYWSPDGRLQLVNRRAVQNLGGGDAADFVGKSYTELFGDEVGSFYLARIREVAASAEPLEFLDRADMPGGTRWYSSVHTRSLDAEGNVVGVHVYAHDVTDLKEAEEALRVSEAGLAEAQRITHVGSWEWDLISNKVKWSDEMYRLFGLGPDAFDGSPEAVLKVVHPDDRERFVKNMKDNLSHAVSLPLEYRVIHPDGAVRTIYANGIIVFDEAGTAVKNIGTAQDVTEQRLAEEALQKFERLFHGNPAPMAVSSLPEGRFIEVNEAFLSALGYSREEVLGHTDAELGLAVRPEEQRELAEKLRAQGRISDCELRIRCKDGAVLDGLFSGDIIESQGQQCFLTVMIDQTQRKRAEEKLRGEDDGVAGDG